MRGFINARFGGKIGERASYRVYAKYFECDNSVNTHGRAAADDRHMSQGGFRSDWKFSHDNSLIFQGNIYDGEAGQQPELPAFSSPFTTLSTVSLPPRRPALPVCASSLFTHMRSFPGKLSNKMNGETSRLIVRKPQGFSYLHKTNFMTNRCLTAICIIAIFVSMVFTPCVKAEQPSPYEYRVKAAFLYNFAKFVEWPEGSFTDPRSSLTICILGKDPFGIALKTTADKKIRGRKLVINHSESVRSVEGCHILFVAKSEKNRVKQIIDDIKDRPVLTISDMDDFIEAGGMIGMVRVKNKIRFHINLGAAQVCGLTISSKLLKLARKVVR